MDQRNYNELSDAINVRSALISVSTHEHPHAVTKATTLSVPFTRIPSGISSHLTEKIALRKSQVDIPYSVPDGAWVQITHPGSRPVYGAVRRQDTRVMVEEMKPESDMKVASIVHLTPSKEIPLSPLMKFFAPIEQLIFVVLTKILVDIIGLELSIALMLREYLVVLLLALMSLGMVWYLVGR